ncbi:helix-turn-helix domain-containing protein [Euzebya tangerina]|uniref:helix-turn-helix domain-containing protein n=1 Tax=Euzebya tangerina TaxID=591198 RepID=UPI000E31ADCD|nr:helix-turn-helix domain-containing protein [Euzebya tangerina]
MTDDLLTLQEAADELKVHYMTAYRWVRRGDLEAFKAGGRLRVRRSALDEYVVARRVDTGVGAGRSGGRRDWSVHIGRLHDGLRDGDAEACKELVQTVIGDGATAGEVYTKLMTPALHRIGEEWSTGEINVAVEHRATSICTGIMGGLSDHFRRAGPRRGVAVTLTAPGEEHGIASTMVADFLRGSGWEVHHLGTQVPLEDLRTFLTIVSADVVCVSVGMPLDATMYQGLAEACNGVQLIMGGQGTDLSIAEPLGITVLDDPIELVDHLDENLGGE